MSAELRTADADAVAEPSGGAVPRLPADEPPPILGSWRAIYAVTIASLALVVALLWALTQVVS